MRHNLIDTPDALRDLDRHLMTDDKPRFEYLAYDTEANGLRLHLSTIVGFSISTSPTEGFYIPLLRWVPDLSSLKTRTKDGVKIESYMRGNLRCIWTGEDFPEFVTPQEYDIKNRVPFIPAFLERWLTPAKLHMWNAPYDVCMTDICTGVNLGDALWLDGSLLVHVLDENHPVGLKPNQDKYREALGINPFAMAAIEKHELLGSILRNGGDKAGQVWRADLQPQAKYACADTNYTFGICNAALNEFARDFGASGLEWFFNKEVMPLCKEVVCDMKQRGIKIDPDYFQKLYDENQIKLNAMEDEIVSRLNAEKYLDTFNIGNSIDEEVSQKSVVLAILKKEGIPVPTKTEKDGTVKESLAKGVIKKLYATNPHWIYGYLMGEDEIKYSPEVLAQIKADLYFEKMGRRHRFNIGSNQHLAWLFCEKLGIHKAKLPQTDSATKENPIPQMGAEVLEEFMLPKYPWVASLLSWKKLSKLQSTYIRPALDLHIDGYLYMDMKQNGTTSGRFSCSGGYNLQTLPRVDDELDSLQACEECHSEDVEVVAEIACMADLTCKACGHVKRDIPRPSTIKAGFVAPPGYKIINADFAALEPRCFAVVSGEQFIKDVYLKELDFYSQFYCQFFDPEKKYSADPKAPNFLKKVAKSKREMIKRVVLAVPYGAKAGQVASLTDQFKEVREKDGSLKKVPDFKAGQDIIDTYLRGAPNLAVYMQDQEEKAAKFGYVENMIGRRRHLKNAKVIADVLQAHSVPFRDFLEATNGQVDKGPEVAFVAKESGVAHYLEADALEEIRTHLGLSKETIHEKGCWKLIKYLLKSDLDNAKNFPIQSLAAHITNMGMLMTHRAFKAAGLDAWVALQVHDEITVYAATDIAEQVAALQKQNMEKNEFTALIDLPMVADPVICDNMKDSK